jgi:hypothetical protein
MDRELAGYYRIKTGCESGIMYKGGWEIVGRQQKYLRNIGFMH